MASKIFAEKGRVKLVGDNRDIAVPYDQRLQVWNWCHENNITVTYEGSLAGIDLWRIKDETHRIWFALRWA
jgi:hypothetical protein